MADNLVEFKMIVIGLLREKNTWKLYSFSCEEEIPTVKKFTPMNALPTDTKKFFGKLNTFDIKLTRGVEYIVKARTKQNIYNGSIYTNLEATAIYPVLDEKGQDDFLRAIVSKGRYEAITAVYPDFVDRVMKGQPINTKNINGIGEKTLDTLRNKIMGDYWKADIMSWLMPLGITERMIQRLLGKYKSPLILKEKLKDNPYILTQIHGLGFVRVDEMVIKMFPHKKISQERTQAFVDYHLNFIAHAEGSTVITKKELRAAVMKNIPECKKLYDDFLEDPFNGLYFFGEEDLGLRTMYEMEKSIFDRIIKIQNAESTLFITNKDFVKETEEKLKIKLSEEQREVITAVKENNFIIVTGYAGVGKTTVIKAILNAYNNMSIGLCSLSAKAANRIKEVTGYPAYTIHRLLGFQGKKFEYNENNPLPYRIIILDEASMANANIQRSLIFAVELGCKIIMVGDDGQLPPIGAGNIFVDLLESDFKICRLTKIYRQAEKSGIIVDANLIRQGINPFKQ